MSARRRPRALLALGGVLWGTAILAGFYVLWRYEATPGPAAAPPALWPADTRIPRAPDRPTLVMLAHPRCICTAASLSELDRVVEQAGADVAVYVLFVRPSGAFDGWAETRAWRRAHRIPGVTVLVDESGEEARRFHATTSGSTVVYDGGGRLVFAGGITRARGQEGDNIGRRRLVALLRDGRTHAEGPAVFGCPLDDAGEAGEGRSAL